MSTNSQIYVWDFTLSVRKTTSDHKEIIKELEGICKAFVFQKEQGFNKENDEEYDSDITNYSSEYETDCDDEESDSDYVDDEGITLEGENKEAGGDLPIEYLGNEELAEETNVELNNDDETIYDPDDYNYSDNDESSEEDEEDDGYVHWQGRISLMKKKRLQELRALLYENEMHLARAHFTPTSNNTTVTGNLFYVMKLDTRIDGPWSNKDEKEIEPPRQLKIIKELYPFQQEIIDRCKFDWSPRTVECIIDPVGGKGKSILALYCSVHKIGRQIPPFNNYLDIMACIMDMPIAKSYFIDFPRSLSKKNLNEFYSGIESIKNGYCFDKRYHFKEKYFDSPTIYITMNQQPDKSLLSRDRWRLWKLENNELYLYNNDTDGNLQKGPPINYPVEEEDEEEDEEIVEEITLEETETETELTIDLKEIIENIE